LVILAVVSARGAVELRAEGRRLAIMLGDSLTAGGRWDGASPGVEILNHGVSGDGAADVMRRIDRTIEARPDLVLLQLGVNDLARGLGPAETARGVREVWRVLIERLPKAKVTICSLLPVREERIGGGSGANVLIREANALLAQAAAEDGLEFVDLYGPMAGDDLELPEELTFDGVHLTPPAYDVWKAAIKRFALFD
jgi:lysophospholipase L1-like esterase